VAQPYYQDAAVTIYCGDCREIMPTLPAESVHCCVTSPPYWGLRDYGVDGQLGLERTPEEYVANLVAVFREVRRALREDGTLWLNLGDTFNAYNGNRGTGSRYAGKREEREPAFPTGYGLACPTLKPKDMVGIPWRVALALQADGWYLRQDIIWHKPNPMPESVTDRCTKAHEYIFLLSKSARYYYDAEAIREPDCGSDHPRSVLAGQAALEPSGGLLSAHHGLRKCAGRNGEGRNKRSVWTVPSQPYSGAHFATFPKALITPCILAGCPHGGTVLDPFGGSGTTAEVAKEHNRRAVLCELNAEYCDLSTRRVPQGILPFTPDPPAPQPEQVELFQ